MSDAEMPDGWTDSELATFAQTMWHNTVATFHNEQDYRKRLEEIGAVFDAAFNQVVDPEHQLPSLLGVRSLAAFKIAAITSMSAPIEAYAIMRSCLEYAGYSYLMSKKPDLAIVWMKRDEDPQAEQAVRNEFSHGRVKRAMRAESPKMAEKYELLYERVIQFGAHPNEKALSTGLRIKRDDVKRVHIMQVILLPEGGPTTRASMRTCAQIGLTAVEIFRSIAPEQFEPFSDRIAAAAEGL